MAGRGGGGKGQHKPSDHRRHDNIGLCLCFSLSPPRFLLISLVSYWCALLPEHFTPVLTPRCSISNLNARRNTTLCSVIFGPSVWNSLPFHTRNATAIEIFKSALRSYVFSVISQTSSLLFDLLNDWIAYPPIRPLLCDIARLY